MQNKNQYPIKPGISNSGFRGKDIRNDEGIVDARKQPFAPLFQEDGYGISRNKIDNTGDVNRDEGGGQPPQCATLSLDPYQKGEDGSRFAQGYTHNMKAYEPFHETCEPRPETAEIATPSGKAIRITVAVIGIVDEEKGQTADTLIIRESEGKQEALQIALECGMTLKIADGVRLKATRFDEDASGRYVQIEIIVDGGWRKNGKGKKEKLPIPIPLSIPQQNEVGARTKKRPIEIERCTCIPDGGPSIGIKQY